MALNLLSPFRSSSAMERSWGDPLFSLHREMNRLFDDVMRGSTSGAAMTMQNGDIMLPQMDLSETDNEVRITTELPGVSESDIDVALDNDILTVRAQKKFERKDDKENYHFIERSFGTFQRSLRLPFPVDPKQIQARYENGVLTITMRKGKEQERIQHIKVQGGPAKAA